jgi:hypothetical protein
MALHVIILLNLIEKITCSDVALTGLFYSVTAGLESPVDVKNYCAALRLVRFGTGREAGWIYRLSCEPLAVRGENAAVAGGWKEGS